MITSYQEKVIGTMLGNMVSNDQAFIVLIMPLSTSEEKTTTYITNVNPPGYPDVAKVMRTVANRLDPKS